MLHVYDSDIFLIYVRIYLLLICGMYYQATVYINMDQRIFLVGITIFMHIA